MSNPVKVWDIATRCFHWSLVIFFFIAYLSGDEANLIHIYSSYVIVALLGFRLTWGFIGNKYARFSNFTFGIKSTLLYLHSILKGTPQYFLGHNPLGGWMVIALLIFLGLSSWTGLELYARDGKGPLANDKVYFIDPAHANGDKDDDDEARHERENERAGGEGWLSELHEAVANFTLLLVFIHIGGVFLSGWIHKENLVKAMWTGYKTPPDE